MASSGSGLANDTAVGDLVSINVNPDGPYGVIFEPDSFGNAATIKEFERLPNGKFGPIQKHGGIHRQDILYAINDTQLEMMPHNDVLAIIRDRNLLKKTFKFMNRNEYYRKRKGGNPAGPTQGSVGNNFLSVIKKTRISQDASGRSFAEYEIACQLRVTGVRLQKDIIHRWSVWKRYSEFEELNTNIRRSLGWQMDGVDFPPSHTFVFNKLAHDFLEQRRENLNEYWQRVLAIDKIAEFQKHHCSAEIKAFLEVDEAMERNNEKQPVPEDSFESEPTTGGGGGGGGRPASLARGVSRRRSVGSVRSKIDSDALGGGDGPAPAPPSTSTLVSPPPSTSSSTVPRNSNPPTTNSPPPTSAPPPQSKPSVTLTPTPTPTSTPTPSSAPSDPPSSGSLPPKASGARANLFADIAKRRVE